MTADNKPKGSNILILSLPYGLNDPKRRSLGLCGMFHNEARVGFEQ